MQTPKHSRGNPLLLSLTLWICVIGAWLLSARADVLENPTGSRISPAGPILNPDVFLGARFQFSAPVDVQFVTGEFGRMYGSYFAALVPLSSLDSLPVGDPSAGVPFNPGEVLSYRTFDLINEDFESVSVPFSIHLDPGVYAVVFGSGLFGTASAFTGFMPDYTSQPGSTGLFWAYDPWRWQDLGHGAGDVKISITFVPDSAVPESGVPPLLLLALLTFGALVRHRTSVREVVQAEALTS